MGSRRFHTDTVFLLRRPVGLVCLAIRLVQLRLDRRVLKTIHERLKFRTLSALTSSGGRRLSSRSFSSLGCPSKHINPATYWAASIDVYLEFKKPVEYIQNMQTELLIDVDKLRSD